MAAYTLEPIEGALHGCLSREIPPAITIQPGDSVTFRTLEADWRVTKPKEPRSSSGEYFHGRRLPRDSGQALCGPIAVRGAKPAMTLAVRVDRIVPGNWGWSRVGGGDRDHLQRLSWSNEELFQLWDIDAHNRECISHLGYRVAMNPFLGNLSVCPDCDEPVSTMFPGLHGGNLDCKELGVNSTLYLPVLIQGAHFSAGDGHAAQGDGEASCTAVECPMDSVTLTFDLLEQRTDFPYARTAGGWIVFGFDQDLTTAAYQALQNMAHLLQPLCGLSYREAIGVTGMVVDLRITQIVNGVRGVHAFVPEQAIVRLRNR